MPKDFKDRANSSKPRPFPVWKFLITGLMIAAFVGFLLFMERGIPPGEVRSKVELPAEPPPAAQPDEPESPAPSRPKYEFYTLLPEKEVYMPQPTPAEPESPAERHKLDSKPWAPAAAPPATREDQFALQVGSFQKEQDADSLRAQLLLLGFTARIQTTTIGQQTWHRVRVGPFQGRDKAAAALVRLRDHQLDGIIVPL